VVGELGESAQLERRYAKGKSNLGHVRDGVKICRNPARFVEDKGR
jgi:hypothetical protein